MKKKELKKIAASAILFGMVCGLTACGNSEKAGGSKEETEAAAETDGAEAEGKTANYDVFECIKQIETDNTLEEVNEIIGFEGEYIGTEYEVYYWQLTEDTGVQVQFFDSGNCRIDIDFKNKTIADKKNDFSKFSEIEEKLNSGEGLTYDEFVQIIGGVEGVLETKSSSALGYTWINDEGGYLTAQFDSETLECESASGWF